MFRARVVNRREDARVALALTAFAAVALLLLLVDDLAKLRLLPGPKDSVYSFVAAMIALGGIGPWIAWTLRGDAVKVSLAPGKVVAGDSVIEAEDVVAVAVAEGARGQSVAIARSNAQSEPGASAKRRAEVTFLEVERREDADEVLEALGQKRAASAALPLSPARRWLALGQAVLSSVCVACAPLYWLAATGHEDSSGKGFYGITGVMAALASFLFLVLRRALPGHAVAVRRAAHDAHVELHANAPTTAHDEPDAEATTTRGNESASLLARGDEPVRAWLARLDALPNEAHAYRGDAMKKDVLWDTLSDDAAPLETRMGAARVLARRHGEEQGSLVRVVEDPDVRIRVEAALEEEEELAEARLETLGPLFRAR